MWHRFNMHHSLGLLIILCLPLFALQTTPGHNPVSTNSNALNTSSYIVQATSTADAKRLVVKAGGTVTTTLNIIDAVGANLSEEQVSWLRSQPDRITVYRDGSLEVSGPVIESDYPTLVGADALHLQGITGQGVTVAVLDTGLWKTTATEFSTRGNRRILAQHDATLGQWINFDCDDDCDDDDEDDSDDDEDDSDDDDDHGRSWSERSNDIDDWNGHGTHITSIIMSSDRSESGRYQGVAPDASVVAVRAFEPDGSGTRTYRSSSG